MTNQTMTNPDDHHPGHHPPGAMTLPQMPMTVPQMCDRLDRLARHGTPPVPQTGWVTLPDDAVPGGHDVDARWRNWGRVVQAADPRFECGYHQHKFRVRPVRDRPWPAEVGEGRPLRVLLALHHSRLRGEPSCQAARVAAEAELAEGTARQALGELTRRGLAESLAKSRGKGAYRLALAPGREVWLTSAKGPGRLTTLERVEIEEAARRSPGGEGDAGSTGDVPAPGPADADDLLDVLERLAGIGMLDVAGRSDVVELLEAVEAQTEYHEAQTEYHQARREHHEAQKARGGALRERLAARRDRLRALLDPQSGGGPPSRPPGMPPER